jgi:hypothetical protein
MRIKRSHTRLLFPLFAAVMLLQVSLACWSTDTWIIPPTVTPTLTPIPATPSSASRYQIGENVTVITSGIAPLYITDKPEPASRRNRVPNAACYNDTVVTIMAVSQVDDVTYYQITCNNLSGWVAESLLAKGR